jgi:hypothetical protein
MNRLALMLAVVLGCTDSKNTTDQLEIQGDACAVHSDQSACAADHTCIWYDYGRPCPPDGSFCPGGVCQSITSGGGGGGSGGHGGTGTASCVCFNGGVCFEQIGGPARPTSTPPAVQCAQVPDQGDRCSLIEDQGHCIASPSVTGLCLCDNGVR